MGLFDFMDAHEALVGMFMVWSFLMTFFVGIFVLEYLEHCNLCRCVTVDDDDEDEDTLDEEEE